MMIGIELDKPCKDIVERALDAGLLINVTADNVVRLLPPLTYTREDALHLVDHLTPLIKDELAKQAAPQSAAA